MDITKEKLNWEYFSNKVESLITAERDRLGIALGKTKIAQIIYQLKEYMEDRKIINDDFWGYGIEQVSNGIKTIEQSSNPQNGYLLCLFKVEGSKLKVYSLQLVYSLGIVQEILPSFEINFDFIKRTSRTQYFLHINSDIFDAPLKIKTDDKRHTLYYSGRIMELKKNPPKMETNLQNLPFSEKARLVLEKLREKPNRSAFLEDILSELHLSYSDNDKMDFAEEFKKNGFARVTLTKDNTRIVLTNQGIDFLQGHTQNKNIVKDSNITAGRDIHIGDNIYNYSTHQNKQISQNHTGDGDNVAGDKIGRQINMGPNSTYIENQNNPTPTEETNRTEPTKKEPATMTNPSELPSTPSGFFGQLFKSIPKPLNYLLAIGLLIFGAYLAYVYLLPKAVVEPPVITQVPEKVFVSGRLYIENATPRPNEVKRLVLRNMPEVNSIRLDGTGKYTFQNVSIPANKKLLVEITFANGEIVPTEELSVGAVNASDNTLYLPDLYAERPKPAKAGRPAQGYSIKIINQNNLGGNNDASQNQ